MNMRFGLKLWSTNSSLLNKAKELIEKDIFQYIELMPILTTEITPFLDGDIPYIIHIPTEKQGVNIADTKKKKFNLSIINECISWADKLNVKYLILHPGFGMIDNAIEFLKNINEKRILIENMPKIGLNDESMVGYIVEQIKGLTNNKFGFCLDFGHVIKASVSLKQDYKKFIEEFLELNPKIFHISDGRLYHEKDEHLNIGDGEYDFEFLLQCIKKNEFKHVTLETPRKNLKSLEEDVGNIEKLKVFINI